MKLFLPLGFSLDPTTGEYADRVMQAGNTAQKNMHEFLQARGIKRKFGSGLLKQLRAHHRDGALDELITRYRATLALGQIADPAPETTKEYEASRYLRHELRDHVTEAPSPRGPLFDVLSLLQQQTGRRIEGHHVLAWRSSRRPSLRQLPRTGANASHAAAHESTQAREADGNLAPVNTPLGAEENGGAVATIAAITARTSTIENPASTTAEAIPTSTAVEATPALTTAAKLAADDVAEEKHAAAVPAAEEKLSAAAIAVAEEKGTTAVIAVAEVKVTTAASSADAAQPLADSGDDSSDDDVVWIPAPRGLPVTTGTGSVRNADDGRDDSEASETEWVPTENLAAPPSTAPQLYNSRAITNSYMRNEPLSVEPSLKTKLATAVDDFETRNLHQRAAVADHFDDFAELFTSR
ncbi:hypothetical protein PF004_g22454 [Phytophthora fragariae]|uniref:Uncharacterized protein n=1 Tax=Phytophthora fragariae TaxID=53985 RepID=A0A6G0N179_9STRA|nr:hypothetical protein PF004_g22454 [Phytophthora fragariae]